MHLQVMLGNKATTHEDYITGFQHAHICSVSQQVSICLIYVYVMLNKMLEENKKIFKTENLMNMKAGSRFYSPYLWPYLT